MKSQKKVTDFWGRPTAPEKVEKPALRKLDEMKSLMQNEAGFTAAFPLPADADDNHTRLIQAIHQSRNGFLNETANRNWGTANGFAYEAGQYEATLKKYNAMTEQQKADRVYLPQMHMWAADEHDRFTHSENWNERYRTPDMIKLKRTRDGNGEINGHYASVIEFKTNEHDYPQREHVMHLLANPEGLRVSEPASGHPSGVPQDKAFRFIDTPIRKFKTIFAGNEPNMSEHSTPPRAFDAATPVRVTRSGATITGRVANTDTVVMNQRAKK